MSRAAALVLAAGRSLRFAAAAAGVTKLLSDFGGKPLVVHAVAAALASTARPVVVVTGHVAEAVRAALADAPVNFRHNADYAAGMATSLKAGLAALPADCPGVVILLADMPLVSAAAIDAVIACFSATPGLAAVIPTVAGEPAHPVLIGRTLFAAVAGLSGDRGARALFDGRPDVAKLELGDPRLLIDTDTPEALAAARAFISSAEPSR